MLKYLFIVANEGSSCGGCELPRISSGEKLVRSGNEVCVSLRDFVKPVSQIEHLRQAGCQILLRSGRSGGAQYGGIPFLEIHKNGKSRASRAMFAADLVIKIHSLRQNILNCMRDETPIIIGEHHHAELHSNILA